MLETLMGGGGDRDSRLLTEIFLQKGGVTMKRNVVSCLMLGAFMLVLTGMPLQLLHIDLVKSAYATVYTGGSDAWKYSGQRGDSNGNFRSDLQGSGGYGDYGGSVDIGDYGGSGGSGGYGDYGGSVDIGDYGSSGGKGGWHENQGQGNDGDNGVLHYISGRDTDENLGGQHENQGHGNDGDHGGRHKNRDYDNEGDNGQGDHHDHDGRCNKKVPEPGTLSLLGAGIAGVGIYSFIRRRSSK
jgi:hypothetical protein